MTTKFPQHLSLHYFTITITVDSWTHSWVDTSVDEWVDNDKYTLNIHIYKVITWHLTVWHPDSAWTCVRHLKTHPLTGSGHLSRYLLDTWTLGLTSVYMYDWCVDTCQNVPWPFRYPSRHLMDIQIPVATLFSWPDTSLDKCWPCQHHPDIHWTSTHPSELSLDIWTCFMCDIHTADQTFCQMVKHLCNI